MFLTAEEMVELTGKRQRRTQVQVLRAIGIEHKIRPDGRVLVLRRHIEELFGAKSKPSPRAPFEPNWDGA
jgi:hypothetical protein